MVVSERDNRDRKEVFSLNSFFSVIIKNLFSESTFRLNSLAQNGTVLKKKNMEFIFVAFHCEPGCLLLGWGGREGYWWASHTSDPAGGNSAKSAIKVHRHSLKVSFYAVSLL